MIQPFRSTIAAASAEVIGDLPHPIRQGLAEFVQCRQTQLPNPGHPTLENNSGDVRYETDFRSVYAKVLDQWLGVNSVPILNGDFRAGGPAIF